MSNLSKQNLPQHVIVGMSGGVDSSVAAILLKQQGYHVEGMFMKNWEEDDTEDYCSASVDLADATSVSEALNIPLHAINFSAEYWDRVFTHFLQEYEAGRTPNPDILCNREIKFKAFLDHALVELAASCPPELKLREGGKYALKKIARGLIPDSVIDRPKGYFPVPALKYVRGEFLDFMRDILDSEACRTRGLYRREYVEQLLAAPEQYLTRIKGSKLWHLALLEFWLQRNLDGRG